MEYVFLPNLHNFSVCGRQAVLVEHRSFAEHKASLMSQESIQARWKGILQQECQYFAVPESTESW